MLKRHEILSWLRENDPGRLAELWQRADEVRRQHVGDAVHLRGLIEISNYCVRQCAYCGLRASNDGVTRYRMHADEIMDCVRLARHFGYGTVVMQAGEDYGWSAPAMADLIHQIKDETELAVTLSLGERSDEELLLWRQAGADRYLLRFETSNRTLYERIHPSRGGRVSDRLAMLRRLHEMGYETGSGAMVGIPGQSYEDVADDIDNYADLDLHMIGVGPFIPHPDTPLSKPGAAPTIDARQQVPNTPLMTMKVVALTRLTCRATNIPSTTALASLDRDGGRVSALARGANVIMPNMTPPDYRRCYEIYPAKACIYETPEQAHALALAEIERAGRQVGRGRGDSPHYLAAAAK